MAKRVHALATHLLAGYDGDAASLWTEAASGEELRRRLAALPGYGDQKSRMFVALLGKQCGVAPEGRREAAGDYWLEGYRSIADVTGPETLARVREFEQAQKQAAKARAS